MASVDRSIFYFVTFFFIAIEKGFGLKCYVCKSSRDEACGFFSTIRGVAIQECANSDDICFHIDYNVDATEGYPQYVERKCVSPNFIICPPAYPGYVSCSACSTSLCNDESTTLQSVTFRSTDKNNYESTSSTFKPTFILIAIILILASNSW